MNTKNNKTVFKIFLFVILFLGLLLWLTNPSLKDFKEYDPKVDCVKLKQHENCSKFLKFSYRKERNYLFYSYYEFSFNCSKDYYRHNIKELTTGARYRYMGILNNFYKVDNN